MLTDAFEFACPWCGQANTVEVDPEEAGQVLIQDCQVCCAPIEISLPAQAGGVVTVQREGDY